MNENDEGAVTQDNTDVDGATTPMETSQDDAVTRKSKHGKGFWAGWIGGGLAVALAAGYVGTAAAVTGTIPGGTTVDGVKVGGKSPAAAKTDIANHAKSRTDRPITVTAENRSITLNAAKAGLSIDTAGAVDGLTGFTLAPGTVAEHLFGGSQKRTLKAKVDRAKLGAAIAAAESKFEGSPMSGSVKFNNGKVSVVRSKEGTGINSDAVANAIAAGWPEKTSYTTTLGKTQPQLTNAEIDTFVNTFANKAMSGPVTVKVGSKSSKLTPTAISAVLSAKVVNGTLKPQIDAAKLKDVLDSLSGELATPAENAHYGPNQQVIEAKDGTEVDPTGADDLLMKALTADDRTMTLKTKPVKAAVTSASLKSLGTELMSEFVSKYPTGAHNAARTKNIKVALAKINGTVVAPGEQFSLLQALTPITKANGYVDAPVLVDGVDELGTGGGISQVSTTLYNATFYAGLQLDEHTAHAYWIPRYPMGREATLWVPTIDNKWTNDSGVPIRIWAGTEGNAAVIRLYGKKVFTVEDWTGPQTNIVAPKDRIITKPGCIEQPAGNGFTVTVGRVVKKDGKTVKNETVTTRYIPSDRVICRPAG